MADRRQPRRYTPCSFSVVRCALGTLIPKLGQEGMVPTTHDVLQPGEDRSSRRKVIWTGDSVGSFQTLWVETERGWKLMALDSREGDTLKVCPAPRKPRVKLILGPGENSSSPQLEEHTADDSFDDGQSSMS
jgi:hypothetical protein